MRIIFTRCLYIILAFLALYKSPVLIAAEIVCNNKAPARIENVKVLRSCEYMGFQEQFNRYYTDPDWMALRTIYVSNNGVSASFDEATKERPLHYSGVEWNEELKAGDMIIFLPGQYENVNIVLWEEATGTYEQPIVFVAERNEAGESLVDLNCQSEGRSSHYRSCFNIEDSNHIAIDGFTMNGGDYGVRTVGSGYAQSQHQIGIAILNNHGQKQRKDPFFSGQSDWMVVENNVANDAGPLDGHGIYLSNGSDWLIVRLNELYHNIHSSDLQINADPIFTCEDVGISFYDSLCDGDASDGLGQGKSQYILIEGNYLHGNSEVGPNLTSVQDSIIRGNIIGPSRRHSTSFWQETDNPNLGSSRNLIEENLWLAHSQRHLVQFIAYSDNNIFRNNILMGLSNDGAKISPLPVLIMMDNTTSANEFNNNIFIGGRFSGFKPGNKNIWLHEFSPEWFVGGPFGEVGKPEGLTPTAQAPFEKFHGWLPMTE